MKNKILFVEDDISITEMVKSYLVKDGFWVTTAYDGEEGVDKFLKDSFDLIILDIMMPKLDGMEVMRIIRERSSVPILIISARDSDTDKVIGLGMGADDYISKPFSLIEISARIKSAIRRATQYSQNDKKKDSNVITIHELTIDLDNFQVIKRGEKLKLTAKEFDILKIFVTNPKRVFTKAQMYNFVWKDDYFGDDNVINVHMRRLREKIEDDASDPKYIKTLWGIGYRLGEF